jgi:hypothetical protein
MLALVATLPTLTILDSVAFTFTKVPTADFYKLKVRYSNYFGIDNRHQKRHMSVLVNDKHVGQISFPLTEGWEYWHTTSISVPLKTGSNVLTLRCDSDAEDACHVNVDWFELGTT